MSSTTTTSDDNSVEASETVAAHGHIRREDWDMIGRLVDAVADETRVRVDGDGMHVAVVNAANVAMFDLHLMPDDWSCERAGMIGLDIDEAILKSMKMVKQWGEDTVTVDITQDNVEYGFVDASGFVVETQDPDSMRQIPDLPDIEYSAQATIPLIDLKEWIDAVSSYKTITVRQHNDDLIFDVQGDLTSTTKTFKHVCESHGNAESTFTIDMLYGMTNGILKGHAKKFDAVIAFDDEYPIRICFKQKQRADTDLHGQYVQAPRLGSK